MQQGALREGDFVTLSVDTTHRQRVRCNHSATHLLHSALRTILGKHVTQKGSLVTAERLRFDFSHDSALSQEELRAVELWVNEKIWETLPVQAQVMPQKEALQVGAMALFGEKYTDEVRVVSVGDKEQCVSIELCGGTHVKFTGELGLFKITQESSIGSGVRRIEALTQQGALEYMETLSEEQKKLAAILKTTPAGIQEKAQRLMVLSKQPAQVSCTVERITKQNGSVWWGVLQDVDPKGVKPWIDTLKKEPNFDIGIFWAVTHGKYSVYVALQEERAKTHSALILLELLYASVGLEAQGGGKITLAQGKWDQAYDVTKAIQHIIARFQ